MILFDTKEACCGCGACLSVCRFGALMQNVDEEGFSYPEVDVTKCKECGLCKKACPMNGDNCSESLKKCFGAKSQNASVLAKSTSGGVFLHLSDCVLEKGGAVYGVCQDDVFLAYHKRATTRSERDAFCGSKYIQSDVKSTYCEAKSDLKNGMYVLFSGTPCQIGGLLSAIKGVDTEKLLTVSIICHGVPSPKLFSEYLHYCNRQRHARIVEYQHRPKLNAWAHIENSRFVYENGDSDSDSSSGLSQAWKYIYYSNAALRPSCYKCQWAIKGHPSDITIGDFWGVEEVYPNFYDKMGVSAVICNTQKGADVFNRLGGLITKPVQFEDFMHNGRNPQLKRPAQAFVDRKKFWNLYRNKGISAIVKRYGNPSFNNKKYLLKKMSMRLGIYKALKKLIP